MKIREATQDDFDEITTLFNQTVKTINAKDYSEEQIQKWSDCSKNEESWRKRIDKQTFFVMEMSNRIVGFSSIERYGYLDFMFAHKDYQRMGIAKELLIAVEQKALNQKNRDVYAFVSETAMPFFKTQGYKACGERHAFLGGTRFVNKVMRKEFTENNYCL